MSSTWQPFATLRRLLAPPSEPALADAGREGELLIARARVGITLLFVLGPLGTLARHPNETPAWTSLAIASLFVMTGLVTIRLARRQHPPQWLGTGIRPESCGNSSMA